MRNDENVVRRLERGRSIANLCGRRCTGRFNNSDPLKPRDAISTTPTP